jgi:hypothetical protein
MEFNARAIINAAERDSREVFLGTTAIHFGAGADL